MRTAENGAIRFQTMSDDLTATMGTNRRERLDGALKAVKRHCPVSAGYLECLVVIVTADITNHRGSPLRERLGPFAWRYRSCGARSFFNCGSLAPLLSEFGAAIGPLASLGTVPVAGWG